MHEERATWHVGIDLGAESGRVMLGRIDAPCQRLELRQMHRFPTARSRIGDGYRWDVHSIWSEIVAGLRSVAATRNHIASVSVDSWGVDYALVGPESALSLPFTYRDPRTDGIFARICADLPRKRMIFEETAIQFLHFNTLYQLLADMQDPGCRELHEQAQCLLMIGDYFNWLLCGVARAERSLASTSQLYNPRTRSWSTRLIDLFGIPAALFPPLVDSGTVLGHLRPEVARKTGLGIEVKVIATCSHDTGSAVAAAPLVGEGQAYLSSGTWSLLGIELQDPLVNDECRDLGFTNEVGFGHSIRLLKNISGLFILQEYRRESQTQLDYSALVELASDAAPLRCLIRPDAPQFARVGGMRQKIEEYCHRTAQTPPTGPGEFARCIYESLALLYAQTLGQLERLTGRDISVLNIVGGGSRSDLLNQLTADACGIAVEAGPAEATAVGNLGIQAIATGELGGVRELRELVRRAFAPRRCNPCSRQLAQARGRFAVLPLE